VAGAAGCGGAPEGTSAIWIFLLLNRPSIDAMTPT
jgi:hypothetical protein